MEEWNLVKALGARSILADQEVKYEKIDKQKN